MLFGVVARPALTDLCPRDVRRQALSPRSGDAAWPGGHETELTWYRGRVIGIGTPFRPCSAVVHGQGGCRDLSSPLWQRELLTAHRHIHRRRDEPATGSEGALRGIQRDLAHRDPDLHLFFLPFTALGRDEEMPDAEETMKCPMRRRSGPSVAGCSSGREGSGRPRARSRGPARPGLEGRVVLAAVANDAGEPQPLLRGGVS
jgi:hypothetical protein